MAVTIVVEDGTGVADANSYVTLDEARTYAEQRGVTLSADDNELGALLVKATDYLEARECDYQGERADCVTPQTLAWPRSGVVLCCEDFAEDAIPAQLKAAQNTLIMAQHAGIVLLPNTSPADYVIEEQVGPIRTKYSDPANVGIATQMPGVEALLQPLFGSCSATAVPLRTMRV